MKFALHFANLACPGPDQATRLAAVAEAAGFESLVTVEHVVWPTTYKSIYPYSPSGKLPGGPATPLPDPIVWMAHVAATTTALRLITGVLVLPQRNPLIVAKQIASLDALSKGRIELGVGVGWLEEEFSALGVPFAERGARADEYIQAMQALWSADDATYHGRFVDFTGMSCNPKPHDGHVPVIVGGHSKMAARRAGRLADGFFPATGRPTELQQLFELVRRTAEVSGRDPSGISFMTGCPEALGDDPLPAVHALAAAGVDRLVVPTQAFLPDLETRLAEFGEQVIAQTR